MVTGMTYEMPKNENIILTYFMLYHLFSFFAAQHIGIYSEKVRTIFFDLNFFFINLIFNILIFVHLIRGFKGFYFKSR